MFEINNDEALASFFKTNYPTIIVKSHAKEFSKLSQAVIFKWAGIVEIIEDNSQFQSIQIDFENELNSKVIEHAIEDLHYKNKFYGPITGCLDSSVREYISPVILACARIAGNVKLVAELDIVGRKGKGLLDYAILYKRFFLPITEARKDLLDQGIMQNIAHLIATREETLSASNNKRNYLAMTGDISSIPSTGVASTGKEWVLIRYVLLPKPAVFKSSAISLPVIDGSPEELRRHLLGLLSKLLGAIDLLKSLVDEQT